MLAGPLLVPLVRLLADPAEKCRELAAGLLSAALPRLLAPAALLPTLLPALAERVGGVPPQEASEEMRLALAELLAGPVLGTLLDRSAAAGHAAAQGMLTAELLPPLCATLCCQLADPFADIKKASRVARSFQQVQPCKLVPLWSFRTSQHTPFACTPPPLHRRPAHRLPTLRAWQAQPRSRCQHSC